MPADGVERAIELTFADSYWNPRPLEAEILRRLLQNACNGVRPNPDLYATAPLKEALNR